MHISHLIMPSIVLFILNNPYRLKCSELKKLARSITKYSPQDTTSENKLTEPFLILHRRYRKGIHPLRRKRHENFRLKYRGASIRDRQNTLDDKRLTDFNSFQNYFKSRRRTPPPVKKRLISKAKHRVFKNVITAPKRYNFPGHRQLKRIARYRRTLKGTILPKLSETDDINDDNTQKVTDCPPGNRIFMNKCILCSPGTYTSGQQSVCFKCPRNFYVEMSGADSCIACPVGAVTQQEGSISPKDCVFPGGSKDGLGVVTQQSKSTGRWPFFIALLVFSVMAVWILTAYLCFSVGDWRAFNPFRKKKGYEDIIYPSSTWSRGSTRNFSKNSKEGLVDVENYSSSKIDMLNRQQKGAEKSSDSETYFSSGDTNHTKNEPRRRKKRKRWWSTSSDQSSPDDLSDDPNMTPVQPDAKDSNSDDKFWSAETMQGVQAIDTAGQEGTAVRGVEDEGNVGEAVGDDFETESVASELEVVLKFRMDKTFPTGEKYRPHDPNQPFRMHRDTRASIPPDRMLSTDTVATCQTWMSRRTTCTKHAGSRDFRCHVQIVQKPID